MPSPFHARGRLLTAAVLAAVLVLGVMTVVWARGGWTGRSDEVAAPSTASSTTPAPPTATTDRPVEPTSSSRDGGLLPRVIQWINEQAPLGGGVSGPEEEAFGAMIDGDCRGALRIVERGELGGPGRSVYEGAAAACLAAFEGRPELWPRAEAAAARVTGQASDLACETRAIHRLLSRLLAIHRADPDARLARGPVGVRGTLSCPRFTSITPDHGPAEGGYQVRITGEHLPGTVGVNFGSEGHHVEAVVEDGALTVTVPVAPAWVASAVDPADRAVSVWPDGAVIWPFNAAVSFTYDPPASSSSETTEPSTSTPEPTDPTDPSSGSSTPPPPPSS